MNTHIIYAGGTFGSYGTPLSALPADQFIPVLDKLIQTRLSITPTIIPSPVIKDSSALTIYDFVQIYCSILQLYHTGARQIILITGTDSLSFLAAFLANALGGVVDLALIITGSMHPLLHPEHMPYTINDSSDAWQNLSDAIHLSRKQSGVLVAFAGKILSAYNTLKIDSQNTDAFVGATVDDHSNTSNHIHIPHSSMSDLLTTAGKICIKSIYLIPNNPTQLANDLHHATGSTAVILIAYGAGNIPHSDAIAIALQTLHTQHIPVVCISMCTYGGVNNTYQAGAWQYAYGVWSGGALSVAGAYGRLLWLALTNNLTLSAWQTNMPTAAITPPMDSCHA